MAKKIILFFISLIWITTYSQSGVLDHNITFTTWRGKTYDLYSLLESGKHIYFLTFKYPG